LDTFEDVEMNIELEKFSKYNEEYKNLDVNTECMSYGAKGARVDLFKINKSDNISSEACLNILLGKSACVIEEWNYKESDSWSYIFNENCILKEFKRTPVFRFKEHLYGYLDYVKSDSCELSITKPIMFNGANVDQIRAKENLLSAKEIQELNPLKDEVIISCYAHQEIWHWQIWYVETEHAGYLYIYNIGD